MQIPKSFTLKFDNRKWNWKINLDGADIESYCSAGWTCYSTSPLSASVSQT